MKAKNMYRSTLIILSLICFSLNSFAQDKKNQDTTKTTFGKGLFNKIAEDSTWYTKIAFRIQTQYEGIQIQELDGAPSRFSDRFRVRRARIKGDGWATPSRRLKYKFEYDVHNGFVLDAVIKWVFDKNR
ncbi:MAG: hypothetical protein HKO93_02735, partial [Flavobacteriales bacterium]|nr:hypothetical protein [Flavobacteriales bacterium]